MKTRIIFKSIGLLMVITGIALFATIPPDEPKPYNVKIIDKFMVPGGKSSGRMLVIIQEQNSGKMLSRDVGGVTYSQADIGEVWTWELRDSDFNGGEGMAFFLHGPLALVLMIFGGLIFAMAFT